jgi:anhydro-N-acetylmuramic acid kinase
LNGVERLIAATHKPSRRVIGIMSGTSVDGIDAALVEISGFGATATVRLAASRSYPFPPGIRSDIFQLFDPQQARIDEICHLDFVLGELFAQAVLRFLEEEGIEPDSIDLIGTTGQTVWHDPEPLRVSAIAEWMKGPIETRSTFAIGQSSVIAERTGILTIGDLRVRDVAAGGQGAPLIAYADWVLLRDREKGRCIQNIGGIGNVTYLPPDCTLDEVIAFDTGPGNMIIDALTEVATGGSERFDRDGRIAAAATVRPEVLAYWLEDPYFRRKPPKTTGREHFGVQFARRAMTEAQGVPVEDLIATATALTAQSIAAAYRDFIAPLGPIDQVILGGGGAMNTTLVRRLGKLLPEAALLRHEDLGIDSSAKEAIAIAVIANDAAAGLVTNVPGATGGRKTVLGKISL